MYASPSTPFSSSSSSPLVYVGPPSPPVDEGKVVIKQNLFEKFREEIHKLHEAQHHHHHHQPQQQQQQEQQVGQEGVPGTASENETDSAVAGVAIAESAGGGGGGGGGGILAGGGGSTVGGITTRGMSRAGGPADTFADAGWAELEQECQNIEKVFASARKLTTSASSSSSALLVSSALSSSSSLPSKPSSGQRHLQPMQADPQQAKGLSGQPAYAPHYRTDGYLHQTKPFRPSSRSGRLGRYTSM